MMASSRATQTGAQSHNIAALGRRQASNFAEPKTRPRLLLRKLTLVGSLCWNYKLGQQLSKCMQPEPAVLLSVITAQQSVVAGPVGWHGLLVLLASQPLTVAGVTETPSSELGSRLFRVRSNTEVR